MSDLIAANLNWATLQRANLFGADLCKANLSNADLGGACLIGADLDGADFSNAILASANFSLANLRGANFNRAVLRGTIFGNNDLSAVKGLDKAIHLGPSTIGVDTLFKSDARIDERFLLGAGLPEDFITFLPSLVGRGIEFYSCFISYSHKDEMFSQRLQSRMRDEKVRVWYAPEEMKGGRKLHEEISRAIQIHDKLLLVLSESTA